ncbi:hypothetical protein N7471_012469, partial [Penicillium samsonianum]|uniref:uncharacterized protein n=1 Tax=Penicillium samsonianum TaxID=1882272 RepID=UPI0025481945
SNDVVHPEAGEEPGEGHRAHLTPSQTEHLLLEYLCMRKPKVDWKKLAELSNVTHSAARTAFTKGRRSLEKWEEKRTAEAGTKKSEKDEGDTEDPGEDVEAGHAEETKNYIM